MEAKFAMHVYFCVSVMTINKKWPGALLPVTTSSLLQLTNNTMHGGETWYAYVFQGFLTTKHKVREIMSNSSSISVALQYIANAQKGQYGGIHVGNNTRLYSKNGEIL